MFTLDNVRNGSYKEADFLVKKHTVHGGRKDVLHEYVNSNKQVIEDLGLKRKVFNVAAIIHGDNYEINKRALIAALDDPEVGTLIHPFFGTLERIKCRTYTLDEDFKEFGVATFQIVFGVSDEIAIPTKATESISEIIAARDSLVGLCSANLVSEYSVSSDKIGSLESAASKAGSFFTAFEDSVNSIGSVTEDVNEINFKIRGFGARVGSLVQAPQELADAIDDLFFTLVTVFPSTIQTLSTLKGMFDFGDDDPEQLDIPTQAIFEINKNNDVFNSTIAAYSLAFAYVALAQTDTSISEDGNPQTIDEIGFLESQLESQYGKTISNGKSKESVISGVSTQSLSLEILNGVTDIRSTSSRVIDEIKTKTPDILSIDVLTPTPLRILSYDLYGNTDRIDLLRSINTDPNVSFYEGEVHILNDNP